MHGKLRKVDNKLKKIYNFYVKNFVITFLFINFALNLLQLFTHFLEKVCFYLLH